MADLVAVVLVEGEDGVIVVVVLLVIGDMESLSSSCENLGIYSLESGSFVSDDDACTGVAPENGEDW